MCDVMVGQHQGRYKKQSFEPCGLVNLYFLLFRNVFMYIHLGYYCLLNIARLESNIAQIVPSNPKIWFVPLHLTGDVTAPSVVINYV